MKVALKGHKPINAIAKGVETELRIRKDQPDLADIVLESDVNRDVKWMLQFW